MRDMICLVLATMIFGQSVLEARVSASAAPRAGEEQTQPKPTLKERLLEVPPGTMIEVRLLNKKKVRGRLGELTDQGFSLQIAQGNKIETQQVAFTDVKSVKRVEGKGTNPVWYVLAGVGALFVVLIIWAAAASSG